jgi:hypothetical protein
LHGFSVIILAVVPNKSTLTLMLSSNLRRTN